VSAEVVAPFVFVAIDRGCEAVFEVDVDDEADVVECPVCEVDATPDAGALPFCWTCVTAEWARKAARKEPKNGRWVGIVSMYLLIQQDLRCCGISGRTQVRSRP
jgi:hypothetical protein